jgi:chromosome segregation ATPase
MDRIEVNLDNIEGSEKLKDPVLVESSQVEEMSSELENTKEELNNKKDKLTMTEEELSDVKSDLDEMKSEVSELSDGVSTLVNYHNEKREAERNVMVSELSEAEDFTLPEGAIEEMSDQHLRDTYDNFDFNTEEEEETEELSDPASQSKVVDKEEKSEIDPYRQEMVADLSEKGRDWGGKNGEMFEKVSEELSNTEKEFDTEEDVDSFVDDYLDDY